jgi:hypothetical protein
MNEENESVLVRHPNGHISRMNKRVADKMIRRPGHTLVLEMPPLPGRIFENLDTEEGK